MIRESLTKNVLIFTGITLASLSYGCSFTKGDLSITPKNHYKAEIIKNVLRTEGEYSVGNYCGKIIQKYSLVVGGKGYRGGERRSLGLILKEGVEKISLISERRPVSEEISVTKLNDVNGDLELEETTEVSLNDEEVEHIAKMISNGRCPTKKDLHMVTSSPTKEQRKDFESIINWMVERGRDRAYP